MAPPFLRFTIKNISTRKIEKGKGDFYKEISRRSFKATAMMRAS